MRIVLDKRKQRDMTTKYNSMKSLTQFSVIFLKSYETLLEHPGKSEFFHMAYTLDNIIISKLNYLGMLMALWLCRRMS